MAKLEAQTAIAQDLTNAIMANRRLIFMGSVGFLMYRKMSDDNANIPDPINYLNDMIESQMSRVVGHFKPPGLPSNLNITNNRFIGSSGYGAPTVSPLADLFAYERSLARKAMK